jgi:hypothetical protein
LLSAAVPAVSGTSLHDIQKGIRQVYRLSAVLRGLFFNQASAAPPDPHFPKITWNPIRLLSKLPKFETSVDVDKGMALNLVVY